SSGWDPPARMTLSISSGSLFAISHLIELEQGRACDLVRCGLGLCSHPLVDELLDGRLRTELTVVQEPLDLGIAEQELPIPRAHGGAVLEHHRLAVGTGGRHDVLALLRRTLFLGHEVGGVDYWHGEWTPGRSQWRAVIGAPPRGLRADAASAG